mgnify:CR=1 FL=1
MAVCFFFQAEGGIRDLVPSRGLGDVYKRQMHRTIDGGSTWESQSSGTGFLYGVCFTDANTGRAVGANGVILNTLDGGSTWTNQSIGAIEDLRDVFFIDINRGIAAGNVGTILLTTDGGSSWKSQMSGMNESIFSIFFTDNNLSLIHISEPTRPY